jgi:LysM repeat protein
MRRGRAGSTELSLVVVFSLLVACKQKQKPPPAVVSIAGESALLPRALAPATNPSVRATAKTIEKAEKKSAAPTVSAAETTTKVKDESPKTVVKEERKAIPVKPSAENTPKADTAKKTYVVAKGDTPVSIAKKFKITSAQLVAANDIEDAHKLKIGQKLVIPAPKEKSVSKEKSAPKEKKKSKKSD